MARQRVAMVFLTDGAGAVLLVRRSAKAVTYPGRLTTVSGPVDPGEPPESAARRALTTELGEVAATPLAAGLPLDFADTIRRKMLVFRVHPFLFRVDPGRLARLPEATWVGADEVIVASASGETIPELDEALARVWDPPSALPPPFRGHARAIAGDRAASSRELAVRGVALVAGGAPPERVAALRPALARYVNAARAAVRPARDVVDELHRAERVLQRDLGAEIPAGARVAVVGDVPAATAATVDPGSADLLLVGAETVTELRDAVAPAGALAAARAADAAGVPVLVVADPWAAWPDDVPPPLEPGLELLPRELVTRVVGLHV
jgi:8-oxo-dGTP pyrophosphatase MutT (NUDIX family)